MEIFPDEASKSEAVNEATPFVAPSAAAELTLEPVRLPSAKSCRSPSNLALSTVPVSSVAGILVKDSPEPANVVAVIVPATSSSVAGSSMPIPTLPPVK